MKLDAHHLAQLQRIQHRLHVLQGDFMKLMKLMSEQDSDTLCPTMDELAKNGMGRMLECLFWVREMIGHDETCDFSPLDI